MVIRPQCSRSLQDPKVVQRSLMPTGRPEIRGLPESVAHRILTVAVILVALGSRSSGRAEGANLFCPVRGIESAGRAP